MPTINHAIARCATIEELERRLYADFHHTPTHHVIKQCVDDLASKSQEVARLNSDKEDALEIIDELRQDLEDAKRIILDLEKQARDNTQHAIA